MAKTRNTQNTFAQGAADLVAQLTRIESKLDVALRGLLGNPVYSSTRTRQHGPHSARNTNPKRKKFQEWMRTDGYAESSIHLYPSWLEDVADLNGQKFWRVMDLTTIDQFIGAIPRIAPTIKLRKDVNSAAKAYKKFLQSL